MEVPSPSWLELLSPHDQSVPSVFTAIEWLPPPAMPLTSLKKLVALAFTCTAFVCLLLEFGLVVPSASCPFALLPQAHNVPLFLRDKL